MLNAGSRGLVRRVCVLFKYCIKYVVFRGCVHHLEECEIIMYSSGVSMTYLAFPFCADIIQPTFTISSHGEKGLCAADKIK